MVIRSGLIVSYALAIGLGTNCAFAETLPSVVKEALRNDPRITGAKASIDSMRARVELAGSAMTPQLRLETAAGRQVYDSAATRSVGKDDKAFPREQASVVASWQFADFGVTSNRIDAAKERESASQHRAERIEQITVADIAEAYLDVWSARRLLELAEDNRATHKRLINMLAKRTSAALSPRSRYEEMLSRSKFIEEEIADIRSALRRAEEAFRIVCGRLPARDLDLPAGNPLKGIDLGNVDALLASALASHPELMSDGRLIEAAGFEVESARSMRAPVLSVEARHGYDNFNTATSGATVGTDVRDTSLMLKARWTLFGELVSDRVSDATAARAQLTAERDRRSREVERILRLAADNIRINRELLESLTHPTDGRLQITEAVWRAANSVLEQKSARDEDIFRAADAKRSLVTTRATEINVTRQKLKAEFTLLDALGQLKSTLTTEPSDPPAARTPATATSGPAGGGAS